MITHSTLALVLIFERRVQLYRLTDMGFRLDAGWNAGFRCIITHISPDSKCQHSSYTERASRSAILSAIPSENAILREKYFSLTLSRGLNSSCFKADSSTSKYHGGQPAFCIREKLYEHL